VASAHGMERERRLRRTGLAHGALFFAVYSPSSGCALVLQLAPPPQHAEAVAPTSRSMEPALQPAAATAGWTLSLLEVGEVRLSVPLYELADVCLDFMIGHHRQLSDQANLPRAMHHFCLVFCNKRPPLPLCTQTLAERQEVVEALQRLRAGKPVEALTVHRLGLLEMPTGRFGSEACLVALVPGRMLVFSAECTPRFVLRPTGVVHLAQQRQPLGFMVRHTAGVTEFIAPDAEMKRVWSDAIACTCEIRGVMVDQVPAILPVINGAPKERMGPGLDERSLDTSWRSIDQGVQLLATLSCSAGFRVCVARKEKLLQEMEQDHIIEQILRQELAVCEAGMSAIRMRLASRLALVAKLHLSGSDVAAIPLMLHPAGGERLNAAATARREARLGARLAAERDAQSMLLKQCVEREHKVERLARTVARLPDEAIFSRRHAGMAPIEAAIRHGTFFFAVRLPSSSPTTLLSTLVLDAEEGTLFVQGGETVLYSFDLADVGPLCLGYRAGQFRSSKVPDSCCLGIVNLQGGLPLALCTDTVDERDLIHRALRLGGETPPLMPPPVLHMAELFPQRTSAPASLAAWGVLLPDRLLLLSHSEAITPVLLLPLMGATITCKLNDKTKSFSLATARAGSFCFSCVDHHACARWLNALSALVPVVHLSGTGADLLAASLQTGRGSTPLAPAVLAELSRQHEMLALRIQLLRQEVALSEFHLLDAQQSAQRTVATALERVYAYARRGLFRSRSRLSFSPNATYKGSTDAQASASRESGGKSVSGSASQCTSVGVALPHPTVEQLLERATWLNAEVRSEMVAREEEIRQLQEAVVVFSTVDWEWATPISGGLTLWDVWHRADERAMAKRISEVLGPGPPPDHQSPSGQEEERIGIDETPAPCSSPAQPKLSFWSSLRSLSSGLPIGVSDDGGVNVDASRLCHGPAWS